MIFIKVNSSFKRTFVGSSSFCSFCSVFRGRIEFGHSVCCLLGLGFVGCLFFSCLRFWVCIGSVMLFVAGTIVGG
uniref:Transmembrane protein n=1 Tax=Helianthus annuus TaxID=4232 RepID=A0A251V900_HELAN